MGAEDPRLHWLVTGALLVTLGAWGLATRREPVHDALHLALGGASLALAFARLPPARTRALAGSAATLYLGLAALGILSPTLFGYGRWLGLRLDVSENILHAAIGAWAAYVASNQ